jgi:hypothetical protein
MRKVVACTLVIASLTAPAGAATDAWVTTDRLNRRTCPSEKCGIVGMLMFREKVTILEENAGWARVTKYYNASCSNGNSDFVDTGNKTCSQANGIVNGQLAEWVSMTHLSKTRPDDPGAGATGDYELVSGSDDYRIYKDVFAKAALSLIKSGQCSREDFKDIGGWMKSGSQSSQPLYFTYCGGMASNNRIYLDASTGETFK